MTQALEYTELPSLPLITFAYNEDYLFRMASEASTTNDPNTILSTEPYLAGKYRADDVPRDKEANESDTSDSDWEDSSPDHLTKKANDSYQDRR